MKSIAEGVVNYIPSILNEDGNLSYWISWSNSFDNIISHPRFLAYYSNETDTTTIYKIIDILFRIRLSMNKLVGESKEIIDTN